TVGKTVMDFLPPEGGVAFPQSPVSRVTIEVSRDELLRAKAARGANRHLSELARLGDGLRRGADRAAFLRLTCEVARDALGADRAVLLGPEGAGRRAPGAVAGGDAAGQLALKKDVVDRCRTGQAILVAPDDKGRGMAIVAPVDDGLLYADKAVPA